MDSIDSLSSRPPYRRCGAAILWAGFVLLFLHPMTVTASGEPASKGRALLDKAVQAIGDPARFDSIDAIRVSGHSFSKEDPASSMMVEMLTPFPGGEGLWMQIVSESDQGSFDRRVAGESSWAKGLGLLPPELHLDAVRYASTKLITLLRSRHASGTEVIHEGGREIEGRAVDVVKVTLQGNTSWLELDRDTAQIIAISFASSVIQEQVQDELVRRTYDDFRSVDGLRLPFKQVVTVGGEYYNEWGIETIELNPKFDPTIFDFSK